MKFVEKYCRPCDAYSKEDQQMLSLEMYSRLYEFLKRHDGLPQEQSNMDVIDLTTFHPWNTDVFTAYKTILYGAILTNLYPWSSGDKANVCLPITEAIRKIYSTRNITCPSDDNLVSIKHELRRIAAIYAKVIVIENAKQMENSIV